MPKIPVALSVRPGLRYPTVPPFHPAEIYPEMRRQGEVQFSPAPANDVYAQMRRLFLCYGLDADRFGGPDWNPLGDWVRPGMTVVLKPNLVRHESEWTNHGAMVTHGSIVRVVMDYVWLALEGRGRIVVADAPVQSAIMDRILEESGIRAVVAFFRDQLHADASTIDLRQTRIDVDERDNYRSAPIRLPGDPLGYAHIDLGAHSALEEVSGDGTRFGVADYPDDVTNQAQRSGRHEYVIARTALDADILINLPKLKAHCKGGLTCALKNMVGVNGTKDRLAHFRIRAAGGAGDEMSTRSAFERAKARAGLALQGRARWMWRLARLASEAEKRLRGGKGRPLTEGGWSGNDTLWRMVLDLNMIVRHYDSNGSRRGVPRIVRTIVDGVVAGDRDGPLQHRSRDAGMLILGEDPVAIDWVAARAVGFEPAAIKMISQASRFGPLGVSSWSGDPADLDVRFAEPGLGQAFWSNEPLCDFDPPDRKSVV